MKKRNGFTLVELLAVIVILALIALIATPIILNIINDAKKSSIKQSAIGYVDAVEKTILEKKTNTDVDYDGKYTIKKDQITKESETASLLPILDLIQLNVNVKGELPTKGNLEIEKSNVISGEFYYNNYLVTLSNDKYKIQVLSNSSSTDTSALETEINNLKAELDAEKKKGATITLSFSGSTALSCNSSNNNFEGLTQSSKTSDSDDIFTYSNGGVVINKTGYYSVSTYAYLNGTGWLNIGIAKNSFVFSMQSFNYASNAGPGSNVSFIAKFQKGDVINQSYWCDNSYTIKYANLGVTYLHS